MEEPRSPTRTWNPKLRTRALDPAHSSGPAGGPSQLGGPSTRCLEYLSSAGRISAAKFSRPGGVASGEGSGEFEDLQVSVHSQPCPQGPLSQDRGLKFGRAPSRSPAAHPPESARAAAAGRSAALHWPPAENPARPAAAEEAGHTWAHETAARCMRLPGRGGDFILTSFSFVTDSYFSSRLRHSNSHFSAFMASSCRWLCSS